MRRGFTIIELLVASLLLGMLVTILTMIFNQSSIAWRTGKASVDDLDDMRGNIASIREESDNAMIFNNQIYRTLGLWDVNGNLRLRACDADGSGCLDVERAQVLRNKLSVSASTKPSDFKLIAIGNGSLTGGNAMSRDHTLNGYTVNVMSAGPDRKFDTYDDIWSWPDEFE